MLTSCLTMLSFSFLLKDKPIRGAEAFDSEMLVNCDFDFRRRVHLPGGAVLSGTYTCDF